MNSDSLSDVPTEDGMSEIPLISIVDDNALVGDGIASLVESLGYNAVTFTSAEHFLRSDVIAETTCLITDVQLPGLSGLELQEALQSQGHLTPVIVITGYPNKKHRTRALENGAVGRTIHFSLTLLTITTLSGKCSCGTAIAKFSGHAATFRSWP